MSWAPAIVHPGHLLAGQVQEQQTELAACYCLAGYIAAVSSNTPAADRLCSMSIEE